MSAYGEEGGEEFKKALQPLPGEGGTFPPPTPVHFIIPDVIKEKKLTFEEASKCLNMLGKDESGVRYAYIMLSATNRKLTDISIVLNFKHVLFLDFTGNFLDLDALQVVADMPFLIFLKAEKNRVDSAALKPMPYLQVLGLSRNRVSETYDINQPMLECLELHYNLIYTAQFDCQRLENLKVLELTGNHLIDISGTYPTSVECLYLASNKIKRIKLEDFSNLVNLKVLHLRDNLVRKLDGFSNLQTNLTYINLRNNKINKIRQFRKLKCLENLDTIVILGNPVHEGASLGKEKQEDENPDEVFGEDGTIPDSTRIPLLVLLPGLKRINKEPVTLEEREAALKNNDVILEQIMKEESSDEETEPPTTTDFTTDEYTTETEKESDD